MRQLNREEIGAVSAVGQWWTHGPVRGSRTMGTWDSEATGHICRHRALRQWALGTLDIEAVRLWEYGTARQWYTVVEHGAVR